VTPADELRDLLTASEKLVVDLRSNPAGAISLLENLDRLSQLWPELETAGVDLRPEAGRWETLQASVRRHARELTRELHSRGGLAKLRAEHHLDGEGEWWWHLDEAVVAQTKQRLLRTGMILVAVLLVGTAAYFLLHLLFPVDPKLEAAIGKQTAGEQKIQNDGDFAGALADFQAATELQPDDPHAWLQLGAVQQKLGDTAGMTESFRRARALEPADTGFELDRSQVYLSFGMLTEAKADIEAVLAADPQNATAYYIQASILESLGQLNEALVALQKASDLAEAQNDPQLTALARYRLAMMLQQMQMVPPIVPTP